MNFKRANPLRTALAFVRKSNVAAATAIVRATLSRIKAHAKKLRVTRAPSPKSPAIKRRYPLGEVVRTLRGSSKAFRSQTGEKKVSAHDTLPGKGEFLSHVFEHEGGKLNYMLYVPRKKAGIDLSLLLMLHGCTQDPQDFALGTQMNLLADEFGFLVAYPHQARTANSSGCWNWFDRRHQQHGRGEPAMLAGLTKSLMRKFNIGARRAYAAGLSAGGAMAEILATTYPNQFEAVGIHSGLPYGAAGSAMAAIGAMRRGAKSERPRVAKKALNSRRIVFHGTSDKIIHHSNGERIVSHMREDTANLVERRSTSDINGRSVTRIVLDDANGRPMVEHWIVEGAGHAWFGGDARGTYTDTKGPDSSREMLRFFSGYTRFTS